MDMPWNWDHLSTNPKLTMTIIENNLEESWNWSVISRNIEITCELMDKYANKPWDWDSLSSNLSLTMEIINKYADRPWKWDCLSLNKKVATVKNITNFPNKPWNYNILYRSFGLIDHEDTCPNESYSKRVVDLDIIDKIPDANWSWGGISTALNLTECFVEKYIDKIDFCILSSNDFGWRDITQIRKHKTLEQTEKIREELYMKTWHPSRVIEWCFDEDEKKGFL